MYTHVLFFFSSRRRHTRYWRDWSSDVCSSDLLIMTLNRKIHKAYLRTREGNFSINGLMGFDLHQKTVGVIGAGRIARIFIKIMRGFDAKVIAYDPYPNEKIGRASCRERV